MSEPLGGAPKGNCSILLFFAISKRTKRCAQHASPELRPQPSLLSLVVGCWDGVDLNMGEEFPSTSGGVRGLRGIGSLSLYAGKLSSVRDGALSFTTPFPGVVVDRRAARRRCRFAIVGVGRVAFRCLRRRCRSLLCLRRASAAFSWEVRR